MHVWHLLKFLHNRCHLYPCQCLKQWKLVLLNVFITQTQRLSIHLYWPPYAIQVKITTVILQGVLHKLKIYQLYRSWPPLGNPSYDNNCNFSRCIAQTQTLSNIPLLASLCNPREDKNCNFSRGSIILTNWREQPNFF